MQIGSDPIQDWRQVALFGFALGSTKGRAEEFEDLDFPFKPIAVSLRLVEPVLRVFDGLVYSGAVVGFNAFPQTGDIGP